MMLYHIGLSTKVAPPDLMPVPLEEASRTCTVRRCTYRLMSIRICIDRCAYIYIYIYIYMYAFFPPRTTQTREEEKACKHPLAIYPSAGGGRVN